MTETELYPAIKKVNQGLRRRFPAGENPFQIMTRLLEECGELAQQVNHFEASGVKRTKHGGPDRTKLAKEVEDVLRCALQIVDFYGIEPELIASVERGLKNVKRDGLLDE